ncbi:chaperonin [Culex quinquefasciatus]|uniref:Chaperonin n=1 Tax=Culex quinquefasciatus TaxID=7176 RepID=B0WWW5_CULQU|nr:chaperonin [Culex quinquefasciatus]|eukprot:XP_001861887.1 chaperonin [Culex quinquefasciatus]
MDSMAKIAELEIAEKEKMKEKVITRTKACTVVIRGATQLIIDKADRSLHDALRVVAAETSRKESMAMEAFGLALCTCSQHAHRRTLQRWPDLDILDSRIMLLEQKFNEKMIVSIKMNKTTSQMFIVTSICDTNFEMISPKSDHRTGTPLLPVPQRTPATGFM